MKDQLNNDFIKTVLEIIPENVSLANKIMEILEIGKEATYRRLRSEVPFTFYEISVLAKKLGISLDQVIGNYESKSAVFNLNVIHSQNSMASYSETLKKYINYVGFVKDDPQASLSTVSNTVPYALYANQEFLTRFHICKWLYQSEGFKPTGSLKEIHIPQAVSEAQTKLVKLLQEIPLTSMIWDSNIFCSLIRDIEYFANLGLITRKDVEILKEELDSLLINAETLASRGYYPNGKKVLIYLSNINFEANYSFLEKGNFQLALLRLYSINSLDTFHPEICRIQKDWIQSLKRYSTLITESGEMQRISFFSKQKEYIDKL